jgi:hypothetical protein
MQILCFRVIQPRITGTRFAERSFSRAIYPTGAKTWSGSAVSRTLGSGNRNVTKMFDLMCYKADRLAEVFIADIQASKEKNINRRVG